MSAKEAKAALTKREALAIPMALWAFVFVGLALLYVLGLSFLSRGEGFSASLPLTLQNYQKLSAGMYIKSLLLSLRLAAFTACLCFAIGYPFAYYMAKSSKRVRTWLMLLVIVPFWTNALIRIYGWKILLAANGPINQALMQLGFIDKPLKLLYSEFAVMVGMVYATIPFMILPVYSSVEQMDWTLVEAARDLGANPIKAFWTVTFLQTLPGVLAGVVLTFIPSIGLFFISDLLGGSTTMLLGNLVHNELLKSRDLPLAAALSMLLLSLTGLILLVYRRLGGKAETMVL